MARSPGLVPLPEPTYRTREDAWVSFDTLVGRVAKALAGDVSEPVVRAVIQVARHAVQSASEVDFAALAAEVAENLRQERVLVRPELVQRVLRVYVTQVDDLDVVQVSEGR